MLSSRAAVMAERCIGAGEEMKIRTVALAGAMSVAWSSSAFAQTGWYVGLGVGYGNHSKGHREKTGDG